VNEAGIEALTMRRVATELGASPMAIYRHIADKDELLVLLLDRSAARLPRPDPPSQPRDRVLAACRTIHAGLIEYPWVIDVLAQGDLIAPSILWAMEEIVAGLLAGGLDPEGAVDGYRAIWQFTVGSLIVGRGLDRLAELDRPPYVIQVLTGVDPEQFPALAALAPHWAAARERDPFELGLGPLVDGLLAGA
jgi:AcrR family transcriptional regulator